MSYAKVSSRIGAKPPHIIRLPSNGDSAGGFIRSSCMIFSQPASRVAFAHARLLAERLGARLTLYHAVEIPWQVYAREADRDAEVRERFAARARRDLEELAAGAPVADLLVPIFFVSVGLKADLGGLNPFGAAGPAPALLALALTAIAVASKLVAGLAVYQRGVARWVVGVGMVPRGEVGLIFAGIGLATAVIDQALYTALIAMVLLSTVVVPPWLRALFARRGAEP